MWLLRVLCYLIIPAIFMFYFAICAQDRNGAPGVFALGMVAAFVAAGIFETVFQRLSELKERITRLEDDLKARQEIASE